MNEWKQVPAWEACKALMEDTHEVRQVFTDGTYMSIHVGAHLCDPQGTYEIRPKVKTVSAEFLAPSEIGLTVRGATHWNFPLWFKTEADANQAREALLSIMK